MDMEENERITKEDIDWDDNFPNGVFAVPRPKGHPTVKVRALSDYCKSKGINPSDLTPEEMEKFLVYID